MSMAKSIGKNNKSTKTDTPLTRVFSLNWLNACCF